MREPFSRQNDLFTYQQRVLPVLLFWGAGSAAAGAYWWRGPRPFWRGVGIQWAAWGAIDALIALGGLRGAQRKGAALAAGTLDDESHADEARKFERILWINAVLDMGYALGGLLFMRRGAGDAQQRGMGVGVVMQAVFLFAFDLCNGVVVRERRVALFGVKPRHETTRRGVRAMRERAERVQR